MEVVERNSVVAGKEERGFPGAVGERGGGEAGVGGGEGDGGVAKE